MRSTRRQGGRPDASLEDDAPDGRENGHTIMLSDAGNANADGGREDFGGPGVRGRDRNRIRDDGRTGRQVRAAGSMVNPGAQEATDPGYEVDGEEDRRTENGRPAPRRSVAWAGRDAGTQETDAPEYDDDDGEDGRPGKETPAPRGPAFAGRKAGTQEIAGPDYGDDDEEERRTEEERPSPRRPAFSGRDTGTQETDAPEYDDDDGEDGRTGKETPASRGPAFAGRKAGTQEIAGPAYDDDEDEEPGEGTNILNLNELAQSAPPPRTESAAGQSLGDALDRNGAEEGVASGGQEPEEEELEKDSPEYIAAKFEIPENAPIDVVVWVSIKQIAYMALVFLRNHVTPLRGRIDRWMIRTKAQNASRNAALSVQERRLSRIVMGAVCAFVIGAAVMMAIGVTKEKLPDPLLVKLLYPYGLSDGTLNGKRFAGVGNVDIVYVGKTQCNEGVEGEFPDCYAYEYKAKNLENFGGKMIIGKNQDGAWMLFNPPKDVAAEAQRQINQAQKRRKRR